MYKNLFLLNIIRLRINWIKITVENLIRLDKKKHFCYSFGLYQLKIHLRKTIPMRQGVELFEGSFDKIYEYLEAILDSAVDKYI